MKSNISIDEQSLSIYFEKDIFQLLDHDNPPSNNNYIKAIALIRDQDGKPLPDIPVAIIEKENSYFDKVRIYKEDNITPVTIKNPISNFKYFSIISNINGELIFYIYPKKSTPIIFQVDSMVIDVTSRISSNNKIYIIDNNNNKDISLPSPDIIGDNGSLSVNPDSNFFTLIVQNYPGAKPNDTILYFINNLYVNKSFYVENTDELGNSSVKFLYNLLKENEASDFYYTVVDEFGSARSAYPQSIIYPGGGYNQPIDNLKRIYDSCIVYNSAGYDDNNNIINDSIIEQDVSYRCNNPHHEGLFVKIIGTNDYLDKTKVPFGAKVTLKLYTHNYQNTVYESKLKLMPTQPDDGDTATLLFGIPFKYIGHIENGDIYFDYEVNYYGAISYGNIWHAYVHTIRPGGEATEDSCPNGITWSGIW
ncbi:hypothetical protein FE394_14070 [Xenorhabdus sp. Reich]|uniref:Uncharacterized protein n=1 Tax=Xenorhabdus littoralis TaxID=2582835 RepID=A0ABU4SNT0_9GAMM|nr:hypothetical protein [Xenorhabdus sp. Reich]MDX8000292.1 hypothetical protein [Xenorhabdus sp. Reich]